MPNTHPVGALGDAHLDQFVRDGHVRIDGAFPRGLLGSEGIDPLG
jgi:hypothetical protein